LAAGVEASEEESPKLYPTLNWAEAGCAARSNTEREAAATARQDWVKRDMKLTSEEVSTADASHRNIQEGKIITARK
jgi:hypothetical protein